MLDYFIILIFFPIILIVSIITKNVLLRHDYGPFTKIILTLRFIGVAIHEISHFFVSFLVGIRPRKIKIKYRNDFTGEPDPHGFVSHNDYKQTFLQATLIALAPLYISTWLFFWSLNITLTTDVNPYIRILSGFFCLSLILGAAPSPQDFRIIKYTFKENFKYSLYQIILLILSGFFVWRLLVWYNFPLLIDLFYYIFVGIMYHIIKYSIKGFSAFLNIIRLYLSSHDLGNDNLTSKKFKPSKPRKLNIEEAHW
ncbi:MAG: hypothetical protein ACFFAO_18800 [Candidatus Hermodarchaeota archaeon]